MAGKSVIIKSDGTLSVSEHVSSPGLDYLQKAVGGYIETVPFFDKFVFEGTQHRCTAFCNEEGKLTGLPVNEVATKAWIEAAGRTGDVLVGDVIVLFGDRHFMESL